MTEAELTVFDAVLDAIKTAPGLSGKIYHAEALKNAAPPFAFWIQDSEETEQALDGYTELESAVYSLHLCARKLESLDPMARSVRTSVIALQGTEENGYIYERIDIRQISPDINEKEVGLYRKVYQISIDYQVDPGWQPVPPDYSV